MDIPYTIILVIIVYQKKIWSLLLYIVLFFFFENYIFKIDIKAIVRTFVILLVFNFNFAIEFLYCIKNPKIILILCIVKYITIQKKHFCHHCCYFCESYLHQFIQGVFDYGNLDYFRILVSINLMFPPRICAEKFVLLNEFQIVNKKVDFDIFCKISVQNTYWLCCFTLTFRILHFKM